MDENKLKSAFGPAIIYIIACYLFPVLVVVLDNRVQNSGSIIYGTLILIIFNFIYIGLNRSRFDRDSLLKSSLLIKYATIPLYIVGGFLIMIFALLMFTPIVFMIVLSPAIIGFLCFVGWILVIGSAPFSLAYLKRAELEGIHPHWLCQIARICQFIFGADVIAMIVLAFKERKCIKATLLVIGLLCLGALIGMIAIIVLIVRAV